MLGAPDTTISVPEKIKEETVRTIIVTRDDDGYFVAYFADDHDARVSGYETKAEAIGHLILGYSEVFGIQIQDTRVEQPRSSLNRFVFHNETHP